MQHVLSVKQFADKKLLDALFKRAAEFQAMKPSDYPDPLKNKIIATVFYEPSTRTRLSFESAIQRLGGKLLTVENAAGSSSQVKGESLEDAIRVINGYADGIVMRHPEMGSAERAAAVSTVPIINGGDGGNEHPTQALFDLFTMQESRGKIDGLKIGIAGDLKHSRTQQSIIRLVSLFDVELFLISPESIKLPEERAQELRDNGTTFHELTNWKNVISDLDVLYCNRIQKERYEDPKDYEALIDSVYLTLDTVKTMKPEAIILDPLPRVDNIAPEVDSDPRAAYFRQAANGLFVRMALLEWLFV